MYRARLAAGRLEEVGFLLTVGEGGSRRRGDLDRGRGDLFGLGERDLLGVEELIGGDRGCTRAAPAMLLSSPARRPTARAKSAPGTVTRREEEGAASGVGLGVGLGAKRDTLCRSQSFSFTVTSPFWRSGV